MNFEQLLTKSLVIHLIGKQIETEPYNSIDGFFRTDKIELMKRNALTFDYLCRASSELNSVFSIPVFYILAIKFVTVVSTAFGYAYRFIHTNDILDNAFLIYPFLIVTESIRILILFTSTDMPVNQVKLRGIPLQAKRITLLILPVNEI